MLPFSLMIMGHVNLPNHTVEAELSLTNWGLQLKRKPETGLVLTLHVGPLSLHIFNLQGMENWFNRLRDTSEENEPEH